MGLGGWRKGFRADSEQPLLPEAEGRKASAAFVFLTGTSGQALCSASLPCHADHIHGGESLECGNVLFLGTGGRTCRVLVCLRHPLVEQAGLAFSRAVEQLLSYRSSQAQQRPNQSLSHKLWY